MTTAIEVRRVSEDLMRSAAGAQPPNVALDRRLEQVESILSSCRDITETMRDVFLCAADVYRAGKQLDALVARYEIEARTSLERLRVIAPVVEQQLTSLSNRIDATLDRAAAIDPSRCVPTDLSYRSELLRIAENQSSRLHAVLMRLMAI